MWPHFILLLVVISLSAYGRADVAPEVTILEEGYGYLVKLPCLGCPFLYQDTSEGKDTPWQSRQDDNALLLNISLPYGRTTVHINGQALYSPPAILPRIYSTQVLADFSASDLAKVIEYGQLEASHETSSGGASFGLSYRHSVHHLQSSSALLLYFDVFELWSGLTKPPLTYSLNSEGQMMLEIVLVRKPVLSALEPGISYEIAKVSLVPRLPSANQFQSSMSFLEWDAFGHINTLSHFVSSLSSSFFNYLGSGVWALFIFILAVIAIFVVVCLFCIFGVDWFHDEYGKAQNGKGHEKLRRKSSGRKDVEHGMRFRSAEDLGLNGRGKVVGVGKSD